MASFKTIYCSSFERVIINCPAEYQGTIINDLQERKATLEVVSTTDEGYSHLEFLAPTRGLIGYRSSFITNTKGEGIMVRSFEEYKPYVGEITRRKNGVLVSMENGQATAYALGQLEDRGVMFIEPGTEVYEGMIVGEHSHDNDLAVNVVKGKKLTNTRASGSDHTVVLKRPRALTLEYCLDYINSDELVEVTPENFRMRKRILNTNERKKYDARKN